MAQVRYGSMAQVTQVLYNVLLSCNILKNAVIDSGTSTQAWLRCARGFP